ncbi:MAG: acyl-CoA dehydrogenase family protein, partial [Myxococcota bacterium]
MQLSFGPEYAAFRAEVQRFIEKNRALSPNAGAGVAAGPAGEKLRDWQRLLIENGYAARTIPKEYGGFGAEPDILKAVIIDEEFNAGGVSR